LLAVVLLVAASTVVGLQQAQAGEQTGQTQTDAKYTCVIGYIGTCDTGKLFPYSNGCVTVGAGSRPSELLVELRVTPSGYTVWSKRIYASASGWHQTVCNLQSWTRYYVTGTLIYSGISLVSIQGAHT
jgi:hypothetical protein